MAAARCSQSRNAVLNVVWDLGNVLLLWEPAYIVGRFVEERSDVEFTSAQKSQLTQMCGSRPWLELDAGTIEPAVAAAVLTGRTMMHFAPNDVVTPDVPEDLLTEFFLRFVEWMPPIADGVSLLGRVREAMSHWPSDIVGKNYILSNFHIAAFEYARKTYPFVQQMDGWTISSHLGVNKPNPEIYKGLLSQHNLVSSECVFIDDKQANVKAARLAGMNAIWCDDFARVESELERLGILEGGEE